MTKHFKIETRSAEPVETRDDDPMAAATAAVEELRNASEEFRTQHTTELRGVTDRLAALETRLNRPTQEQRQDNGPSIEQRAFNSYVRRGAERMGADEIRALAVSTTTAGGYLVPYQFLREIDRNLVLFSPIRSVARIQTVSEGEVRLPNRTGTMTASWEGETDAAPPTQPTYGQGVYNVAELKCYVDVSNRLLEDAAFNIESELAYDISQEFGRAEATAFVTGDGTNKPLGFLNTTGITTGVTTADPAAIVADEIMDLYHSLPTAYAARGAFAMNRTTIGQVRKLKSSMGEYYWQESLADGNPPTLLGRPVIEFPDMPDPAAGVTPIIFGSFMDGFRIFDRVSLSILRDPYSQQTNGLVRFHARRRVGGGVSKAEAFRFLTMHA
ncbi:MAG: phage major capsid protein [Rhodoblastus sp.]|nr:phage major capsid protein [Rhodoblastus sp.]MCB9999829.1 phage major capsid protein [Methylobacteriaceae bacterium]MCC0001532.1 phage major capsid protein [Methylobacteriaceae bacterium]MCC2112421.1 phage major capsid protein [Hyphomicrobiales bacterium]